eukprot:TRINITY_DN31534_c0_g1_i1.p1 TRINITY_DN31534_c0_g1~~TRINITY_DN31534_c0_g1_i1.p1  ORF type:complete len:521 (-),score=57.18 TRINITY_DN31534_c0_g1_i1:194-1756(-)
MGSACIRHRSSVPGKDAVSHLSIIPEANQANGAPSSNSSSKTSSSVARGNESQQQSRGDMTDDDNAHLQISRLPGACSPEATGDEMAPSLFEALPEALPVDGSSRTSGTLGTLGPRSASSLIASDEADGPPISSASVMSAISKIRPPRTPFDEVRLLRVAGQGSFSTVYYGIWAGAAVAVKVMASGIKGSQQADAKRNLFEALLSSALAHPHLVRTFKNGCRTLHCDDDADGSADSCPADQSLMETWIVQEWCDAGTLRERCQRSKRRGLNFQEALEIVMEVSGAGSYLHEAGILHGDLTPTNVLLQSALRTKGYVCKVCDFGLSQVLGGTRNEVPPSGNLSYMAPETFTTKDTGITRATDIYAFGLIVYEIATGIRPFEAEAIGMLLRRKMSGELPTLAPDADEILKLMYENCTQQDPSSRPSFQQVLQEVLPHCEGDPPPRGLKKSFTCPGLLASPEELELSSESEDDLPLREKSLTDTGLRITLPSVRTRSKSSIHPASPSCVMSAPLQSMSPEEQL